MQKVLANLIRDKKPRDLLWVIPLVLFITTPLWKPALSNFLAPQADFADAKKQGGKDSNNFKMNTVEITLTTNGQKEWLINAKKAQTGATDREINMEIVHAKYIGKEKPPTIIQSKKGNYFINKRHLILIEDVVVEKPLSKEVLYTDLLHYYDANKMAVSPGAVKLKGPHFQLQGGRMDYDFATNGYDFSKGVVVDL